MGCVWGDHYLAVSTLHNRGTPALAIKWWEEGHPGGDMRTDDTLLTSRREQVSYIVPEVGLAKHT